MCIVNIYVLITSADSKRYVWVLPARKMEQVQNFVASPLNLCTRKRPMSPDFYDTIKRPTSYVDSSTCQYSPVSNSDSEHSDNSADTKLYSIYNTTTSPRCKSSRPFKAYSKDPLTLAQGVVSADMFFQKDSAEAFVEFRNKIMSKVQTNHSGTNKNMRRVPQNGPKNDDPEYWEKRKKNNEAAKRSRDARRAKEDEIAIRCAFLEQENVQLKFQLAALETERLRLHNLVYQQHS